MRLIDADARVTVQSFDVEHEEYEHIEMSVAEALDFATNEGCPPTVDAIPVEWLVNLKNEYAREGREQAEGDLMNLLLMWQKEQEAQDAGPKTT